MYFILILMCTTFIQHIDCTNSAMYHATFMLQNGVKFLGTPKVMLTNENHILIHVLFTQKIHSLEGKAATEIVCGNYCSKDIRCKAFYIESIDLLQKSYIL